MSQLKHNTCQQSLNRGCNCQQDSKLHPQTPAGPEPSPRSRNRSRNTKVWCFCTRYFSLLNKLQLTRELKLCSDVGFCKSEMMIRQIWCHWILGISKVTKQNKNKIQTAGQVRLPRHLAVGYLCGCPSRRSLWWRSSCRYLQPWMNSSPPGASPVHKTTEIQIWQTQRSRSVASSRYKDRCSLTETIFRFELLKP